MQLQYQKDFFIRSATASDQNEVVSLIRTHSDAAIAVESAAAVQLDFLKLVTDPNVLFRVALNSNGVIIGALMCTLNEWSIFAVNPNFMRREVKEVLLGEVKSWVIEKTGGVLALKPKLVTGDWKTYVKSTGAKIEKLPGGLEEIRF